MSALWMAWEDGGWGCGRCWWVWFGGTGSVTILAMATLVPFEVEPAPTGTTIGSQEKATTLWETSTGAERRSDAVLICGGP